MPAGIPQTIRSWNAKTTHVNHNSIQGCFFLMTGTKKLHTKQNKFWSKNWSVFGQVQVSYKVKTKYEGREADRQKLSKR